MNFDALRAALDGRRPGIIGGRTPCAVLVPLAERDGQLHLVYELRSSDLNWQPGEVCFPGGGFEPWETALDCAKRETWEELGLTPEEYDILGELDYIVHFTGFPVYPVLARLHPGWEERLHTNPAEVAEVFTIPLSHLREHPPASTRMERHTKALDPLPEEYRALVEDYPLRERRPIFFWPYRGKLLWGMTAWITKWLLDWLEEQGL